ncbi:SBBP repeat-containing protein [bacterium]|nr:SBBP repeat-containing protein [bacterium]
MKKALSIMLVLLLFFLLPACGGDEEEDDWGNDGDGGNGNNNGVEDWEKQWGANNPNQAENMAISHNDIIYVAGETLGSLYSERQGKRDAFLAAFNTNGQELWGRQLGSDDVDTFVSGLSVDKQGNIYFATNSIEKKNVMKFSQDGSKIWDKSLEVQGVTTLGLDDSGNIYVGTSETYDILKFSPDGEKLSTYNLFSATKPQNSITKIAVDSEGNIYAGGWTSEDLFAEKQGGGDAFLVKLAPDGTQLWGKQWGGSVGDYISVHDMLIDNSNNLYVTAHFDGAPMLLKFSPTGENLWRSPAQYAGSKKALSFNKHGQIYLCGRRMVYGFNPDGNQIWEWESSDKYFSAGDISFDSKNNLYIFGSHYDNFLIKISSSNIK